MSEPRCCMPTRGPHRFDPVPLGEVPCEDHRLQIVFEVREAMLRAACAADREHGEWLDLGGEA